MHTPIHKALTFRASSIGDCLMGKYVLENIHQQYPQARLGIVVAGRSGMIRDVCRAYPWLEIIEANRRNPMSVLSLLKNFWGSDFVVTQYAGKKGGRFSFASKLIARLLARRGGLIGFTDASRLNGMLYDRLVPVQTDIAVAEHDRAALRAAGVSVAFPFPKLSFVRNATIREKLDLEAKKYVVVHLFAGNKGRGLSPEKKSELLSALARELPGTRLVLSGGVSDRDEAVNTAKDIPATIIAGEVSLQELMNLIAESCGVVSVDTGVAHIAAQLGKPLIVMHTCLGRAWWLRGQYGDTAPITMFSCGNLCTAGHVYKEYPDCMNNIYMNEVAARAAVVLTQ